MGQGVAVGPEVVGVAPDLAPLVDDVGAALVEAQAAGLLDEAGDERVLITIVVYLIKIG